MAHASTLAENDAWHATEEIAMAYHFFFARPLHACAASKQPPLAQRSSAGRHACLHAPVFVAHSCRHASSLQLAMQPSHVAAQLVSQSLHFVRHPARHASSCSMQAS
jgi:hypothetical protein